MLEKEKAMWLLANPHIAQASISRALAERKLIDFIKLMWHELEPKSREFVDGWHIHALCDHLEAVSAGHIKRLLINVPPGSMKSLAVDVFWPAFEWGPRNMPELRYVSSSYSEELTKRDNRRGRRLIRSDLYQSMWGDRFTIPSGQDTKLRYENDKTGFRIATSVGGLGTGERGDRLIIDDPHNVKDGESEAKRTSTLLWFTEVMPTRLNDPEDSAIIVIMQRVHGEDVSGLILERELGYTHLCLPMEYESDRKCTTSIGFEDPRHEEGELLWPDRMTAQVVERDKKVMGSYAAAGQFQQRPSPRGGGMFQGAWFGVVDPEDTPKGGRACRGWDLAASKNVDSAYTAGVKLRKVGSTYYIEDVVRFKGSPSEVERSIKNTAQQDGFGVAASVPQDPGQAGKAQAQAYIKLLDGYDIRTSPETGAKEDRARPMAAQAEAGNVKIVKGPWNRDFIDEVNDFPRGKFKDQVDALSRAHAELNSRAEEPMFAAPMLIALN